MVRLFLIFTLIFALVMFSVNVSSTATDSTTGEKPTLTAGYSLNLFGDVDINDAKMSTKMWTELLIKKKGFFGNAETVILKNSASIEKAIRTKGIDIVVIRPEEYFDLNNKSVLEPIFVSDYGRYFYHEYLLIVRTDSGIEQLSDLKNKKITIETTQNGTLVNTWIETIIMRKGYHTLKDFFHSIKDAGNASKTLLPVFFRQADAAVVNRSAFETMQELNPQLGKELKVIATSPNLLTGMVCLRKDFYRTYKAEIMEILDDMHKTPQGRQILMLFRINRLVPFKPVYMETVEALLKEHKNLKIALSRKR